MLIRIFGQTSTCPSKLKRSVVLGWGWDILCSFRQDDPEFGVDVEFLSPGEFVSVHTGQDWIRRTILPVIVDRLASGRHFSDRVQRAPENSIVVTTDFKSGAAGCTVKRKLFVAFKSNYILFMLYKFCIVIMHLNSEDVALGLVSSIIALPISIPGKKTKFDVNAPLDTYSTRDKFAKHAAVPNPACSTRNVHSYNLINLWRFVLNLIKLVPIFIISWPVNLSLCLYNLTCAWLT